MESAQNRIAAIWKDTPHTFSALGSDIELLAFLPREADSMPIAQFESIQKAYGGHLDIEYTHRRIVVGRKFLAYSKEDVEGETVRFRKELTGHLMLETTLQ